MMKSLLFLLTTLLTSQTTAQNVVHVNEIEHATSSSSKSPFLSTTLSTKVSFTPSTASSTLTNSFDTTSNKQILSETLTHFLSKIFNDQNVYNVKILSVSLFNDHLLNQQDNGSSTPYVMASNTNNDKNSMIFTTVISGEYTNPTDKQTNSNISNESFRKMLIHITNKFQNHLMSYIDDLEVENYIFGNIDSVTLYDYDSTPSVGNEEEVMKTLGMSQDTVNIASIIAIVVSGLVFVLLSISSVRYYKKAKQLKAARWRSKEAASVNTTQSSSILGRVNHPIVDDYSFDPFGAEAPLPSSSYRDDPLANNNNQYRIEEEDTAFSSVWPTSAPPAPPPAHLFNAHGSIIDQQSQQQPTKLTYTQELQTLPKQHVFAPPGKIGVAIDVYNGQPVVHKIRKGSPLENMLQPNDVIVAIDEEDTSCLSAADVTSMMVKRMDRVRKITYVRRP